MLLTATLPLGLPLAHGGAVTPQAGNGSGTSGTVWLCRPGQDPDPCNPGLSTTRYTPTLQPIGSGTPPAPSRSPIDCFYVYPTVSQEPTGNANLEIGPEERSIALYQAARFSQVCRVFAPMYRQLTLAGIGEGNPTTPPDAGLAFSSLQSAFTDYLRHDNHGRGFVLIGHSQGAFILRQLIARDIDPDPALRRRLVSAILLGGNVLVRPTRTGAGGDFRHVAACRSPRQTGCVIAYSTFDGPVPADSLFGRPSGPGANGSRRDVVLCTNPASLAGGAGLLDPISPTQPFAAGTVLATAIAALHLHQPSPPPRTVWYSVPGSFRARCTVSNGAHVLEVTPVGGASAPVPSPTPEWGLHLLDVNIALGNLVGVVREEAGSYASRHAPSGQ